MYLLIGHLLGEKIGQLFISASGRTCCSLSLQHLPSTPSTPSTPSQGSKYQSMSYLTIEPELFRAADVSL